MAPRKGPEANSRSPLVPPRMPTGKISKPPSSTVKRRPGRPFKLPPRLQPPQPHSTRTAQPPATSKQVTMPPPRALSMLEALPVEVIEQIFLYSLNLNFPRASRVLAAAVSSERIYGLLILLACWDDPPSYPSSDVINRALAPIDYRPLSAGERDRLQQAVFRCRWCTMDRVREQIPIMMILTIHRHWINAGIQMEPEDRAALDRFLKRQDDTVRVFYGKGEPFKRHAGLLRSHPSLQARLSHLPGPHTYELHITPMVRVEIRVPAMKTTVSFPALSLCRFPTHMIRGRSNGFTSTDVAFLEMLRITSDNFKYKSTDSPLLPSTMTKVDRTALHQGVTTAIRMQNFNAMISLLKIDEYCFRFQECNLGHSVFYTIPSDHFLMVTRHGRDKPHLNLSFFEALVRASAESLPPHSQEINAWALDNIRLEERKDTLYNQMNARFGRWLLNFMMRLPEQIEYSLDFPNAQLFTCGQVDPMDLEGCCFMQEVLDPIRRPLDSWMEESMFHPDHYWLKKAGSA